MNATFKRARLAAAFVVTACTCAVGAQALTFDLPPNGDAVIGEPQTVVAQFEDTLPRLALAFGLGYREIVAANPDLNPWVPGEGTKIHLPTRFILPEVERKGVVLNLSELRLYYFPEGENRVVTYPIGIGRQGWQTPTGLTRITTKTKSPSWYPPQSIRKEYAEEGKTLERVVPPGPDNPLGDYALRLGIPAYLIHGTNKPLGVGMRVSHGCIRLYPDDIEELMGLVPVGTQVRIIQQPYKAGWLAGRLYLEAHKPLEEELENDGLALTTMVGTIIGAHKNRDEAINWELAESSARRHHGLPVPITAPPLEPEK